MERAYFGPTFWDMPSMCGLLPIIEQEAKVIINLNIHRSRGHRKEGEGSYAYL